MVEAAGGKVVNGNGDAMKFNQQVPKHRGVVAAGMGLADDLQALWRDAMADHK